MDRHFSARQAAKILKTQEKNVQLWSRAAGLGGHGGRGRPRRLTFGDLCVLRVCARLNRGGIRTGIIRDSLTALQGAGITADPLSTIALSEIAGRLVAQDRDGTWEVRSGQCRLELGDAEGRVVPAGNGARSTPPLVPGMGGDDFESADRWFEMGAQLEETEPMRAYQAYLRALACDPEHAEAMINIGRLCAGGGDHEKAAAYFRQASRVDPEQPVAHFNLGVTLQDLGDTLGAITAYRAALGADPRFADAHYNIATLLEQEGDRRGALKHMAAYRVACEKQPS